MIKIEISDIELYDNSVEEFVSIDGGSFRFEHSLEAISKWEAKWKVHFLNNQSITNEQLMDYYKCMCLDEGLTLSHLTPSVVEQLHDYIEDPMTATKIQNDDTSPSNRILTSEVIYGYLVSGQIPFETAGWHINRLLTLLAVVSSNHSEPKKMTREEVLAQNRKINEERKRKYKTKG